MCIDQEKFKKALVILGVASPDGLEDCAARQDYFVDCCSSCHAVLDGAVKSGFTKDELRLMHLEGVLETNNKLADKGLLIYL